MDTLGLAPLGLPDLEHRYSGIEPNLVAPRLFQYAHDLYERGRSSRTGTRWMDGDWRKDQRPAGSSAPPSG